MEGDRTPDRPLRGEGERPGRLRTGAAALGAGILVLCIAAFLLAAGAQTVAAAGARSAAPAYHVYFGDLHGHTQFSDGKGTPEQAYAQVAEAGADFLALTDHREGLTAVEWERTRAAAAAATTAGFAGLSAFEVKPAIGHLNVYDSAELPPIGLDGAALYDWIAARSAVAQWNHPLRNSEDFADFAHRTAARDAAIRLLEIVNHGSVPLEPDYEASYIRALDKGWHVMPTANGDVHDATWITGNDERTALLATELTPGGLYEAMRARRGYATRFAGLVVEFRLGGAVMGSEIRSRKGKLAVAVHVRERDAAAGLPLSRLEVVTNGGKVAATSRKSGTSLDWTTRIPVTPGRYYYLRVWVKYLGALQIETAWTAPVWVTSSPRAAGR